MRAWIVVAVLALTGCATGDQRDAKEDATCRSYGAQPGTPLYVACRMKLADERVTFAKMLLGSGEALQGGSVPGPPPLPGQGSVTATRLGGPAIGMCMKAGESFGQGYKVCRYNCGGSPAVLNVGVGELCPMSPR